MKYPLLYLFLIFAGGMAVLSPIFFKTPSDYVRHKELSQNSSLSDVFVKTPVNYSTSQTRKGIKKEIWLTKGALRHHFQLVSPRSEMFICHDADQKEFAEKLFQVRCYCQEDLYFSPSSKTPSRVVPMQQVCLLEAEEALFSNQHFFIGSLVKMSRYQMEGHELPLSLDPSTPFMQACAQKVKINFSEKEMKIHTEGSIISSEKESSAGNHS